MTSESHGTHDAMTQSVSDAKPWPLIGYAPGNYQCKCVRCGVTFLGDKRAVDCLECAAILANEALTRHAEPTAVTEARESTSDHLLLVAFFNEPEAYKRWGHQGDYDGLTPAETAIRALRAALTAALSASAPPELPLPSREWMRDKIATDPDLEAEVRPPAEQGEAVEPVAADLIERLQPRWATDEELTRAAARRDMAMREIVSDFLVANNALKREAASALAALQAKIDTAPPSVEVAVREAALEEAAIAACDPEKTYGTPHGLDYLTAYMAGRRAAAAAIRSLPSLREKTE